MMHEHDARAWCRRSDAQAHARAHATYVRTYVLTQKYLPKRSSNETLRARVGTQK